jgi:hypothetical protein
MFTKSLIAAALAVALSGTAFAGQVYQGGPKSGLSTRTQSFEANKPFAQALDVRANKYIYQSGPKATAPHGR